jgi:glycosyltransferase involved in cell wall biosynthesis
MTFAIMITTRNRCEELRRTLAKVQELQPEPNEILICADGCTDNTNEMVRSEFPHCILIANEQARGSVFSRDRLLRLANSDIVLSLDDDSYPIDSDFLSRLATAFEVRTEAAVITFVELRGESASSAGPAADLSKGQYVSAYPNCAAAMRRDVYLRSQGFPIFFDHMYEELDFALQCYAQGHGVWYEPGLRVRHHLISARHQSVSRHHLNARNELWSVGLRCPWPWLPGVAAYRIFRQLIFAASQGLGWVIREPQWWVLAMAGWGEVAKERRPVPWRVYRGWLQLNRQPIQNETKLRQTMGDSQSLASSPLTSDED